MDIFQLDDDAPAQKPSRPDCPGCGEPDLAGDDFCHECGHSFAHFGEASGAVMDEDGLAEECPICATGTLVTLEYGRTQCDSCGYTSRDEG